MAQDPNSGYNPDPEKPYDVPSTYETPAQLPYDITIHIMRPYHSPLMESHQRPPMQRSNNILMVMMLMAHRATILIRVAMVMRLQRHCH